jgi:uncharacterized membrane protein YhaH (DUF805 family)
MKSIFVGRCNRMQYFVFSVIVFGFIAVFRILASAGNTAPIVDVVDAVAMFVVSLPVTIALVIVSLSINVRRLHDLNMSGWWYLAFLIPGINVILGLILLFFKGTEGPNRYGTDPLASNGHWG